MNADHPMEHHLNNYHVIVIRNRGEGLPSLAAIREMNGTAHLLSELDTERLLRQTEQRAEVLRAVLVMLRGNER